MAQRARARKKERIGKKKKKIRGRAGGDTTKRAHLWHVAVGLSCCVALQQPKVGAGLEGIFYKDIRQREVARADELAHYVNLRHLLTLALERCLAKLFCPGSVSLLSGNLCTNAR
jgi:hypothetical protein